MGTMREWAANEIALACKRENPDWDGKSFDYGCSCYQSALKAYNCLMDDGHSGYSMGVTKRVLMDLLDGRPLSLIVAEDFEGAQADEYSNGIISRQCPRMSSLFQDTHPDGNVTYHDNDRCYCVNIEEPSDTFHSGTGSHFVDELYPISLPYYPSDKKFKIYMRTFNTVSNEIGCFDTQAVEYIETPWGEKINIHKYFADKGPGPMVEISYDEYIERCRNRKDTLDKKIGNHIMWTIIENSTSEAESERRRKIFNSLSGEQRDIIYGALYVLCGIFNDSTAYLNTFSNIQKLAKGECDIPELEVLQIFIKDKVLSLFN